MNRLKQHLNDSLQELEMTQAMHASILSGTAAVSAKTRCFTRPLIVLLAVLCLSFITVAAAVYNGWNREAHGFMTWEAYQSITPFKGERPPILSESDERYVIDFQLALPGYEHFTEEQQELLRDYRNREKDATGGGIFNYQSLDDAKNELGIAYLQGKGSKLQDAVSMRVSGPSRWFQVSAKYTLYAPEEGYRIFFNALLNTLGESGFTTTAFLKEEPIIADIHLRRLDCDATLLKWSDDTVMVFFTHEAISYEGSIAFDTPPEDLFAAAVDVLETLHD